MSAPKMSRVGDRSVFREVNEKYESLKAGRNGTRDEADATDFAEKEIEDMFNDIFMNVSEIEEKKSSAVNQLFHTIGREGIIFFIFSGLVVWRGKFSRHFIGGR